MTVGKRTLRSAHAISGVPSSLPAIIGKSSGFINIIGIKLFFRIISDIVINEKELAKNIPVIE